MTQLQAGQVAVVTGAAAGIGFALAEAFAKRGLRVALADADAAGLADADARLREGGATVLARTTDVSDLAAVVSLREAVLGTFGQVDVVCNNAGVHNGLAPLWERDLARWRRLVDINYWGVVHGIHAFLPVLLHQERGHVLVTASMSGLTAVPGQADYGSSKHAAVAVAESLRVDLDLAGATGVGVTLLCPALVRTEMGERVMRQFTPAAGSGLNLATKLEPSELARLALEGIEQNRLHVTPSPGSRERFLKRVQPILDNWWPA
jgi:NADP-dependent 3-hydroxy acid dehydrogenase YdfG